MLKRFIFIFALVILLLGLFFYQVRQAEIEIIKERIALSEMGQVNLQERVLTTFFIGHIADVEIISELYELKKIAMGATDYSSLGHDFLSFSGKRGCYDQIRYLDKNGLEKIRVDVKDGKPLLVAKFFLQDKSDRYYFDAILQLKSGQIYLSPLDLNVEKLEIEYPFKPMLRIGTQIVDQSGEFQGALIINYLAAPMLAAFRESSLDSYGENSLLNYEGFWLSAEISDDEWGFMLDGCQTKNFARRYPLAWKEITSGRSGQLERPAGLFTFSTFNPVALKRGVSTSYSYHLTDGSQVDERHISYPWKIVSLVTKARMQEIIAQKLKNKEVLWLGLFGLLFLLSGSLLWIFLKYRQKKREQLVQIARINASQEIEKSLKDAKAEAEKNSAAKTLFLSSMSHEFRTPMNSILGFAQLLADEDSLGARERNFVEKILVSGDHLKVLINDILDLAKIEAGAVEINLVDINLCSTVHDLVGVIESLAKAQEIKLFTGEPETRYLVRADSLRLQQIILNLLGNAVKYNRIGGQVELFCTKLDEEWVRFNVVDDGPGIAPDKRPFLFQPFNRLGAETSSVQGSGIGLVISKNLTELMGCRLGLLDKDGSGCHFYLDLPIVGEVPSVALNTPMPELETSVFESSELMAKENYSCTLLYIEDNELNRMLLASIIEKRPSFTLLSAVDGRQGIEMALKGLPDLILADIGLPDIDGFAVLDELQKHTATGKIPVVALSGNASKEDIEKAYAAGFVGYLTKPINVGHLFETIDEILLKT